MEDKYEWHDLRKDPYARPPIGVIVLGYFRDRSNWTYRTICCWHTGWQYGEDMKGFTLIAWKRIEPFKYFD